MVRRRQILLATLAAGTAGTAGCVSDDPSDDNNETSDEQSTDEEPPSDLVPTADGVYRIDVDAIGDRSASVGDATQLTYAGDPEVVWAYERILEGRQSDESTPELAVDPVIDTTDDVENVFLAPAYDADTERWEVHAYVDETYVENRDTQRFWIGRFHAESDEKRAVSDRDAAFTEHHDGVYRATVEYGEAPPESAHATETRTVVLSNREWKETALEEMEPVFGAAIGPARVGPPTPDYDEADEDDPAPVVDLSFEYDPDAKTVTIGHEGGPLFQGEHVQVGFEGGLTETQFSGEVTVGDDLTVAVPSADPGEYLAVTWRGPETEHTIVLGRFQIPE